MTDHTPELVGIIADVLNDNGIGAPECFRMAEDIYRALGFDARRETARQIALDELLAKAEDATSCLRAIDNGKWHEYDGTLLLQEDDWGAIREELTLLKTAIAAVQSAGD